LLGLQPQQSLTTTKPQEGLTMSTENINTKSTSIPDYQATYTAIFNASNQIEVARAYISSVDDTESMKVCAKRGIDLILNNVVGSLAQHVEGLMNEEVAIKKAVNKKTKPNIQSVVAISRAQIYSPAMYDYLVGLRSINPNSCGEIVCDNESLKEIINLGSKVSVNLKSGLQGVGEIISCVDQGKFAISLGWVVNNLGDILLAMQNIETNLLNCLNGKPWPNIKFERAEFSFTTFLTHLPYTSAQSTLNPNNPVLENLLKWCKWQEGCQSSNIRHLHNAIGNAINTGDLDINAERLGNLIVGEWAALVDVITESESASLSMLNM